PARRTVRPPSGTPWAPTKQMSPLLRPDRRSRLLVEPGRVVPQELALRLRSDARPLEDVVDGVGELTLRVRIVGGVHQDVVAQHAPDVVEHVLAFVTLDGAEEAPARHVLAGGALERGGAADIHGLLVHALGPEGKPA